MVAAEHDQAAMVRRLMEVGAAVDQADEEGRTALFRAAAPEAFAAYCVAVEFAAADKADFLNGLADLELISRVDSGDATVLRMLVEAGARIDVADEDGVSPLMLASGCGHPARVTELLNLGADRDRCDADGRTAWHHARKHPVRKTRRVLKALLRPR